MRDHPLLAVQPLMRQPSLPERMREPANCLLEAECVVHAIRTVLLGGRQRPIAEFDEAIDHAISKLVSARYHLNKTASLGEVGR